MALIKCPKCGCLNAISFSKCSDCKYNLNLPDNALLNPPQSIVLPPSVEQSAIEKPILTPKAQERPKTNIEKFHKTENKLTKASNDLKRVGDKLNRTGNNIQKVGMGCCGTVVWLFIFLIIIGSCSSAIKNRKSSSSSSESLRAEIESSRQPEEKSIEINEPQSIQQTEIKSHPEPSEEYIPIDSEPSLPEPDPDPLDDFSTSQKNAILQARSYLEFAPFSRNGLIDQLSSEYGNGYSIEDATLAVEYLESEDKVDWNEQAIKQAKSYLETSPFSRQGLIDQLSSEYGSKFTIEEAENAIVYLEDNNSVDWYEQAARQAESYLENFTFSEQELIDQLSSEHGSQFTVEEAEYGANRAYTDNNQNASFEAQDITNRNLGNENNFYIYDEKDRQNQTDIIILNTKSKKMHNPWCASVPRIAPANYAESSLSVEQLEAQGYEKCRQAGDW